MSVSVVQADEESGKRPTALHLLPCEICANGPAPVTTYFKVHPLDDEPNLVSATFRGRELQGRKIDLAANGFEGVLLQDTLDASLADGEERKWMHRGSFDVLTYYKRDERPTARDPLARCVDFAKMARVLHSPLLPDEA